MWWCGDFSCHVPYLFSEGSIFKFNDFFKNSKTMSKPVKQFQRSKRNVNNISLV